MSDTDRVLRALRRAGPRGITRVDFQAPDVIDGGKPILNIPGRIHDLEHTRGVAIDRLPTRRDKCVVYVLRSVVPGTAVDVRAEQADVSGSGVSKIAVPEPTQLPVAATAPRSMYDPWEDAA